jgi:hypothetical protein
MGLAQGRLTGAGDVGNDEHAMGDGKRACPRNLRRQISGAFTE